MPGWRVWLDQKAVEVFREDIRDDIRVKDILDETRSWRGACSGLLKARG